MRKGKTMTKKAIWTILIVALVLLLFGYYAVTLMSHHIPGL